MFNLVVLQIWYQSQLRFFLWDMEYGVKILRKLGSEEWGLLWYPWRFVTLVMSTYLTHILLVYSSLSDGSIQCIYSLISSITFEGDFEQQVKGVPMHVGMYGHMSHPSEWYAILLA